MDTPIFNHSNVKYLNLLDHSEVKGSKVDKCRIEYMEGNKKRVFNVHGYIQSITFKRHNEPYSHIGMTFGGHIILDDLKGVAVYEMEHIGKKCYSIVVVI